jgi:hypothetical protein
VAFAHRVYPARIFEGFGAFSRFEQEIIMQLNCTLILPETAQFAKPKNSVKASKSMSLVQRAVVPKESL